MLYSVLPPYKVQVPCSKS